MSFAWDEIDIFFEVAFGNTLQDAAPTWTDVSDYVERFNTVRRRDRILDRFAAGRSTWWVDNSDGRFDPNNSSSPYDPDVKIGVPARIRVTHDTTDYTIFNGSIPSWPLEYEVAGDYAWLQLTAINNRLASLGRDLNASYPIQRSDQRIDAVLDDIGWPAAKRDIDVGDAFVAAVDLEDVNALDHIDQVVIAEVGHFFVAADGKAAFRSRTAHAGGAVSQATFGSGNIEFDEIGVVHDDEEVFNDVRILRTGGAVQVSDDATAQAELGYTISWPSESTPYESAVFYTDHGAKNSADWLLGRHKDVELKINHLAFSPMFDDAWATALGLDLRQAVRVQWQPPGGGTAVDQVAAIEGIRHAAAGGGKWVTTYDLEPLSAIETEDYWILGTSELDTEARLA